jgi:signal peptidase I
MRRLASPAALLGLTLTAAVWLLRRQLAVVTVSGPSMRPAFQPGDRVLVRRARLGRLRPGSAVLLERPDECRGWITPRPRWPGRSRVLMIKRVAALPGDPVPDLTHPAQAFSRQPPASPGHQVPDGTFVVLGDNPGGSYDSRVFGYCPAERLLGVVVCTLPRPAVDQEGPPMMGPTRWIRPIPGR